MTHISNFSLKIFAMKGSRCQRNFRFLLLLSLIVFVELRSASAQMKTAPSGWVERGEGNYANPSGSTGIGARPYTGPYIDQRSQSRRLRDENKPVSLNPVKNRGHKHRHPTATSNSDRLAALPIGLRVGTIFDKNSLRTGLDHLEWFKIPNWMSGSWMRTKQTVIWMENYVTGEEHNDPYTIQKTEFADWGVQSDKQHNIWHACLERNTVLEKNGFLLVGLVRIQEPRVVSNQKVVLRDLYVGLKVNKETNVIMESQQVESITTYLPLRDDSMTTSIAIFGEEGLPIRLQENAALDRRVSPFAPVDSFNGANIKNSFLDFLKTKGL